MRLRKPPFSVSRKCIKVFTMYVHVSVFTAFSTVHTRPPIRDKNVFVTSLCSTVLSLNYACLGWNSYSRWDMQMNSDVSVFENLSTLIRWTSVFKNLHSGKRFRKPPFLQTYTSIFDRIRCVFIRKRMYRCTILMYGAVQKSCRLCPATSIFQIFYSNKKKLIR